jgi:hypothetical protein
VKLPRLVNLQGIFFIGFALHKVVYSKRLGNTPSRQEASVVNLAGVFNRTAVVSVLIADQYHGFMYIANLLRKCY